MLIYTLHFDGSCWPNPNGTAASGFTLKLGEELIDSGHRVLGTGDGMSNNVAEYDGLIQGLDTIKALVKIPAWIEVYGDSNLVIKQMSGIFKIHEHTLYYPYAKKAQEVLSELRKLGFRLKFNWISRDCNTECDELSKKHLTSEERTKLEHDKFHYSKHNNARRKKNEAKYIGNVYVTEAKR